jgi:hypothetical protein
MFQSLKNNKKRKISQEDALFECTSEEEHLIKLFNDIISDLCWCFRNEKIMKCYRIQIELLISDLSRIHPIFEKKWNDKLILPMEDINKISDIRYFITQHGPKYFQQEYCILLLKIMLMINIFVNF